jgi:hypothetical protein
MRTAVVREPNAVAVGDIVAEIRLARPNPNGILIAWVDRDRTDRADRVGRPEIAPAQPAVCGLPDAAVGAAEIVEIWIAVGPGYAGDPATGNRRSDVPPLEALQRRYA